MLRPLVVCPPFHEGRTITLAKPAQRLLNAESTTDLGIISMIPALDVRANSMFAAVVLVLAAALALELRSERISAA